MASLIDRLFERGPFPLAQRSQQLARTMRRIGPGAVEIERQFDGRIRMGFWFAFLLIAAIIAYDSATYGIIWSDIRYAWDQEAYLQSVYDELIAMNPLFETSPEQSAANVHLARGDSRTSGILFVIVPALLLLCAIAWPRQMPVRVDGARGVVYTWARSRLYAANLGTGPGADSGALRARAVSTGLLQSGLSIYGPLEIVLPAADGSGGTIKRWLGTFPSSGNDVAYDIQRAIHDLAVQGGADPAWLTDMENRGFHWTDPLRAVLDFTLFPGHRIPEDKALAELDEFLAGRAS